jgi:hypothetical protein
MNCHKRVDQRPQTRRLPQNCGYPGSQDTGASFAEHDAEALEQPPHLIFDIPPYVDEFGAGREQSANLAESVDAWLDGLGEGDPQDRRNGVYRRHLLSVLCLDVE